MIKLRHGYSLVELLVVMGISITMIGVATPLMVKSIQDAQFARFTNALIDQFVMARQYALATGLSVHLDFAAHPDRLLRTYAEIADQEETLFLIEKRSGYEGGIRLKLPKDVLPHPHSGGTITDPFKSTHKPEIIFGLKGSSSGTILFSDPYGRAVCAVISGTTGRVRVYTWSQEEKDWLVRY